MTFVFAFDRCDTIGMIFLSEIWEDCFRGRMDYFLGRGAGGVIIGILDNREMNLATMGLLYSEQMRKYKRAGE